MAKSSPSPAPAPDPNVVSAAQTQSNQQTALFNSGLNNINQNTPLGSISYTINPNTGQMTAGAPATGGGATSAGATGGNAPNAQQFASYNAMKSTNPALAQDYLKRNNLSLSGSSGTSGFNLGGSTGATGTGNGSGIPSVTSNITLNPDVQHALTSSLQTKAGEADTAQQYLSQVNAGLAKPAPTADAGFQKQQLDNMSALQQPFLDRQKEQLNAQLAAQGIVPGSEAYHNAMLDYNNSTNNLQEQNLANATSQEQAQFGLQQAAYTLPLNEFSALQSGSQVQQPQFSSPSPVNVNPTNTAQNAYNSANINVANNNAATASQNQLMSSLFGLGGSLGAAYLLA